MTYRDSEDILTKAEKETLAYGPQQEEGVTD